MLTISNNDIIIKEATMDGRDERLIEIILRYRDKTAMQIVI